MTTKLKAIEINKTAENFIETQITGKLTKEDYEDFVPELENLMKEGKRRLLLQLNDFRGWTAGALWEDTKFSVKHFRDIERIAIVGDKQWEKGIAEFSKPFTKAAIRYFDLTHLNEAREWIQSK